MAETLPAQPSSKAPCAPQTQSSPGEIREIAALVSRLLYHYWTANDPPAARQAQLEDWLDDLREFGPAIVEEACREWRRKPGGRRPTPGDIRAICVEDRETMNARAERELALPAPDWEARRRAQSAAEQAENAKQGRVITDRWARQQGYENFDAYLDAGGTYAAAIQAMSGLDMREPAVTRGDAYRAAKGAAEELADFRLPASDSPGVRARLQEMGEE